MTSPLAGGLAWLLGRLLAIVDRHGVARVSDVLRATTTPTFPLVRLAVIEAVLIVAAPYLTRPARWAGQLFGALLVPAAMYLGTASPNDLAGGLVLGWGVAAAIHLAIGSPAGRPTAAKVGDALADLGVPVRDVRLAPVQPPNQTVMLATDAKGDVRVRVQVRFPQRQGVDLASAVAAGGLLSMVAGVAVQLGMLAVALPLSPLTNQVVATYLPAIPGWFATQKMVHRDLL